MHVNYQLTGESADDYREEEERTLWCVQVPGRPTFFLDPKIQGIMSASHCAAIANGIVDAEDPLDRVRPDDCRLVEME